MALTISVDEIILGSKSPLLAVQPHWERVRLGEIGHVLNGCAFKSELFSRQGGMPLIRIRDVGGDTTDTNYLGDYDERYVVRPGDLLIGMDGDFNCARWRGPPALLNQRVCKVAVDPAAYAPRLLDYVLPGYLRAINHATSSITVKHLSSRTVAEIPLPRPPFDEQHRIVAEIEKQFSRLDQAVASLQRVKAQLKRYKASVLKAAVEGRLVETEAARARREGCGFGTGAELAAQGSANAAGSRKPGAALHHETGEQLLKRILDTRRSQWKGKGKYKEPATPETAGLPELPEGWVWSSVDQTAQIISGLTKNPKRGALPVKLPYLRVANVYANELRLDEIEYIGVADGELEKLLLQQNDLLVVEGNGSPDQIGRVALWDGSISNCVHQNHIIKVRFRDSLQPKWAMNWLLSPGGRHQIEQVSSSTSGLHTLSTGKVSCLPVPLPPLAEQHRIVAEVDRRLSIVREVEAEVDANVKRAQALRQAVLTRAFTGASS